MHSKILDNSLDFFVRSATEIWDNKSEEPKRLKYSTINLFEGIELLLKSYLVEVHWSLVLKSTDDYKANSYEKGDFQSVSFRKIISRLENVCDVKLNKRMVCSFDELRKLRNKYVHFVCHESQAEVLAIQLKAWHHALILLDEKNADLSCGQKEDLRETKKLMVKSEKFIGTRFLEIQPKLEELKKNNFIVIPCSSCSKESLVIGNGSPQCLVYAKENISPVSVAEDYLMWRDDDLRYLEAWCPSCKIKACTPVGEDICCQAEEKLLSLKKEPREALDPCMCFSCGTFYPNSLLRHCAFCSAYYFQNDDIQGGSRCVACNKFNMFGSVVL